jgi:hypothetical protein
MAQRVLIVARPHCSTQQAAAGRPCWEAHIPTAFNAQSRSWAAAGRMEIQGTCGFYTAMSVIGLAGPSIRGQNVDSDPTTLCIGPALNGNPACTKHQAVGEDRPIPQLPTMDDLCTRASMIHVPTFSPSAHLACYDLTHALRAALATHHHAHSSRTP